MVHFFELPPAEQAAYLRTLEARAKQADEYERQIKESRAAALWRDLGGDPAALKYALIEMEWAEDFSPTLPEHALKDLANHITPQQPTPTGDQAPARGPSPAERLSQLRASQSPRPGRPGAA